MTAKASRAQTQNSPSTSHSQDALSLQVTLPQMLDLALGTPEVGALNFNILHNFLHVLLHQINLRTTKVEYRGDEANRIRAVINTTRAGSSLQLHEYSITDSASKTIQRKRNSETEINADVYTDTVDAQDSLRSGSGEKMAASAPVTARGKNGSEQERNGGVPAAKRTRGSKQQIGTGVNGERQSVIFVEPVLNGVAPTALGFKRLEETILNLQQRFEALDELANNPEMIERVRSSKTDPLSNMWHVININKRLDGCEAGIEKLTTMLQDLIKSDKIEVSGDGSVELGHLNERILELENQLVYLSGDVANLTNTGSTEDREIRKTDSVRQAPSATMGETSKVSLERNDEPESTKVSSVVNEPEAKKPATSNVNDHSATVKHAVNSSAVAKSSSDEKTSSKNSKSKTSPSQERRSVIGGVDLTELRNDVGILKSEIIELKKTMKSLNENFVKAIESPRRTGDPSDSNVPGTSKSAMSATSGKPETTSSPNVARSGVTVSAAGGKEATADETSLASKKTASKLSIKPTDSRVIGNDRASPTAAASNNAISSPKSQSREADLRELESRVSELEREIGCVNEKLNGESSGVMGVNGNGGIDDLIAKIQVIQGDMDKINETASRLMDEKDNRESHTNALIEQIELLKTIKADKEDLEDALADKADAHLVNRKVSHDQFDAACDDLARGIEEAITKLGQQESIWQQGLDEVQREIDGKLDKIEISPLKEFVNNRLKLLQEKLRALAEMRRESEAAGTKKMLSDVQCISCDANVVMRMEEGGNYRAPMLPSTKSVKPYLTYELDQVRKQQRRLPNSRNMIQFEAAMQEMARKSKPSKEELSTKSPRDHLCNRYCGGSHTITTPQQRVMRMGHFLTQWGPEAIQLTEGVIRGNDGQLYRSRPMPGKPDASGQFGEIHAEIRPETPSSPMIPENVVASSQRQSQISRGRSSMIQAPSKRSSARRHSELSKGMKNEEIPVDRSRPPSGPPGTIVDDGETVPEPPGPTDEVVREPSIENSRDEAEDISRELED